MMENPINERQLLVLRILPSFLAPLSIISSIFVLVGIRQRKLHRTVYGRLMMGLSGYVILAMFVWMLGPTPVPRGVTDGAFGNTHSCATAGFMLHFANCSTIGYSVGLIVFSLLTISFGVQEDYAKRKVEPFIHAFAVVGSFVFALPALLQKAYNPGFIGMTHCAINSFPAGCQGDSCERGSNAMILVKSTVLVPGFLLYAACNVAVFSVYWSVNLRVRESQAKFGLLSTFRSFKAVERQTVLYAIFFFITQGLMVIMPLLMVTLPMPKYMNTMYPAEVLFEILFPLQGLCICIIFLSPRFVEIVHKNPEASYVRAYLASIFSVEQSCHIRLSTRRTTISRSFKPTINAGENDADMDETGAHRGEHESGKVAINVV